ncbi:MAG: hypothetical protein ACI808_001645 [Paraglaciecola sp.]|jgi:hypothetical protein
MTGYCTSYNLWGQRERLKFGAWRFSIYRDNHPNLYNVLCLGFWVDHIHIPDDSYPITELQIKHPCLAVKLDGSAFLKKLAEPTGTVLYK